MNPEDRKQKLLRRWYVLGIYFFGSLMMTVFGFLRMNAERACDPCEWRLSLMFGLSYLFMWPALMLAGAYIKGNEPDASFFGSLPEKPRHVLLRKNYVMLVLIAGTVLTYFGAVFRILRLIEAGKCRADRLIPMIWESVYPGWILTAVAALLVWLGFRLYFKNKKQA